MSRRGNCWDNAPQESFFGHFKDEAYIKPTMNLSQKLMSIWTTTIIIDLSGI
jgi:hypothetical protein